MLKAHISVKSTPEHSWHKRQKIETKQTTNLCLSSLDCAVNLSQLLSMLHRNFHEHDKKKVEGRELQKQREKAPPCALHVEGSQLTDHKAAFTALIQTVRLQGNKFKVGGGRKSQRAVTILNRHLAAFISAEPVLQVGNWNICLLPRLKAALQTSSIIPAGLQWQNQA